MHQGKAFMYVFMLRDKSHVAKSFKLNFRCAGFNALSD